MSIAVIVYTMTSSIAIHRIGILDDVHLGCVDSWRESYLDSRAQCGHARDVVLVTNFITAAHKVFVRYEKCVYQALQEPINRLLYLVALADF